MTLASVRKVPALNRERRVVNEDDSLPTGPALTGGDVDTDWEGPYASGDEASGGDNPTFDQAIIDDIGKELGVNHEDSEELKGEEKISDRDKRRWELDPKSAEDYEDQ